MPRLAGLLLALLLATSAHAATYYVTKTGNDTTGTGAVGAPWLTIQKAANTAVAGDTVHIGAGTYVERLTFANSGTAGSRITYVGTRTGSAWDTIIDGSTAVGTSWVAAPEMGQGVYKTTLGYNPWSMTSNNLAIWRIGDRQMNGENRGVGTGQQALNRGTNESQTPNQSIPVLFWDGIDALYGFLNGTTYLRFRNQEDPTGMTVRAAPTGATVDFNGKNYITLQDVHIQGGQYQVRVRGGSTGITVHQCSLIHGQYRFLNENSTNTTLSDSKLVYQGIGFQTYTPGDWNTFLEGGYARAVNRKRYDYNKFLIGDTNTDDSAVTVLGGSTGFTIAGTQISHTMAGITFYETSSNTTVANSSLFYFSDNGVYLNHDFVSASFHHNLIYDCDHCFRFESMENTTQVDIYANRFFQPWFSSDSGPKHIFVSARGSYPSNSLVRIYQNSFAGAGWAVDNGCGAFPFVHMRNNYISTLGIASCGANYGTQQNNIGYAGIWFNNTLPTFILPGGNAGLNTAPSLISLGWPGMTTGYYVDSQPDYGAIQGGAAPGDTTPPVVAVTAPANGASVSGAAVVVTASASDNVAVVGVQFRVDGVNVGSEQCCVLSATWDSTSVANGSHTLSAVARDAAGNTATTSVTVNVTNGDSTPPSVSITTPAAAVVVSGAAVFVAATASDNVGIAGVQFKLDGSDLGSEQCCSSNDILWNTLLTTNGSHVLTAVARDAAGNTTTSASVTVTVTNAVGDTTPPTVAVTAPAAAATVDGDSVSLTADASDDDAVVGVWFKVDGVNVGAEDMTSTYGITWDSTTVPNGSHAITAVARDAAGNMTTSAVITVTVTNDTTDPAVAITAPAPAATVAGTAVVVTATASDNTAVVGVQFQVDAVNLGSEQCCTDVSVTWNTALATNASHALTAIARDAAGNTTTSATVTVTVFNDVTPPTVAVTAPSALAVVSGAAVAVTGTASDNVAVAGVQFKLDGLPLGAEDTSSPFAVTWDTSLVSNGTHTLTATARDAAGNLATSAGIVVVVTNGGDTVPPVVALTAPEQSSLVSGSIVAVTADATDDVGVYGVQFTLDGVNLGAEDVAAPYSAVWDTTLYPNGGYTLAAIARDAVGNTVSNSRTVTVANAAPPPASTYPSYRYHPTLPPRIVQTMGADTALQTEDPLWRAVPYPPPPPPEVVGTPWTCTGTMTTTGGAASGMTTACEP